MTTNAATRFKKQAGAKAFDTAHRRRINFNMGRYHTAVEAGRHQFADMELARKRAALIKRKVIENLDKYLINWETNFKRNGGKVIWATDAAEAVAEITQLLKARGITQIVKSKSMVTEEIKLNEHLQAAGIEAVETDLGEYIQQLDGEPPYHIVTPAMHKSKEDVAELFHRKLGTPPDASPRELTLTAREILRQKYMEAGAGITGANFLLADIGGVHMLENEGNGRMSAAWPKVHIVITGIEKIIPSVKDLPLYLPLLSTFGTGQKLCNYNTIYTGPKRRDEWDGPQEMFVVLLDNGRTRLLEQVPQREALSCIRCGACLNACPVYKNIGGHTYDRPYSGPIGSVISPHLSGLKEYVHLSHASTLCGNCTEVCPVNIDLHKYLLYNRQLAAARFPDTREKMIWAVWKRAMLKRSLMNRGSGKMKGKLVNLLFKKSWGRHRAPLQFAEQSFSRQWKEKNGGK